MPRPRPDEFLAMADAALYNAKSQGRGRFVLFEPNMPTPNPGSLSLDADIRSALGRKQLELFYQPVMRLADLQVVGMEALLRWNHPQYGLVSPKDFIPLAEETGVIKSLGRWIAEEACERISGWQGLYGDSLTMSINLSALQFRQKDTLGEILEATARAGLKPGSLQLEITETVLLSEDAQTAKNLADLRARGFKIALDDFGVGYSALSYLKKFEIDTLKLDQSFLSDLNEPRTLALVSGIVQLGHALGMKIVAEGIEDEERLEFVRRIGCDEGQGYLLSRPLDEKGMIDFLTSAGLGDAQTDHLKTQAA
jgi:EAL domain-containing protein (putative c-di-GMP-specific phosphodiesterase class I)